MSSLKRCAHCGIPFKKDQKYAKKKQDGAFLVYFYWCKHCHRWTGIDYRYELKAKFTREEVFPGGYFRRW